jgi:hypothetical protein
MSSQTDRPAVRSAHLAAAAAAEHALHPEAHAVSVRTVLRKSRTVPGILYRFQDCSLQGNDHRRGQGHVINNVVDSWPVVGAISFLVRQRLQSSLYC